MDKRKVIEAYRRRLISSQECAQILGLDNVALIGFLRETPQSRPDIAKQQPVRT
ncbi:MULTISPECIES: hypothetical protein [Cohnella]|uniref:hypothetical protein n=1 Tax=Cohnella TaxID=329857 RepID=UPI001593088C|nr:MULTISPECIES: hypothetical protein [Cohnella]MBN2984306.1 hypothetical protein [Cohnella algarum]